MTFETEIEELESKLSPQSQSAVFDLKCPN